MYVLLLIALFVFGLVAHAHGVLVGLAAGVGTFVGLIGLVLLLGRWAAGRQPAAGHGENAPPAMAPAPQVPEGPPADWEAVAPRAGDRTLPRDRLPYPLGNAVADGTSVPPGYLGRHSYLVPLIVDLGPDPRCWSPREKRWVTGTAAVDVFLAQLYEGWRGVLAEAGDRDEEGVAWVGEDDIARHRFADRGMPPFIAFRSRDARWGGFHHGGAAFRFPLERLVGLHLEIRMPARGPGEYRLKVFAAGGRESWLEMFLDYRERTTVSLLEATMQWGKLFDVPVSSRTYANEVRTFDEPNPHQW
jgi:hypothetical protein